MQSRTHTRSVPTDGESLSEAVVTAVATAAAVDPVSLTPRLYDVIDPDALDRLSDAVQSSGLVISFTYGDWVVRVQHDAVTVVDGADTAAAETEGTA